MCITTTIILYCITIIWDSYRFVQSVWLITTTCTVIHYQQLLKVQRRWKRQINNDNRTTNNNTVLLIVVIFQRDWSKSVVYSRRFFNNKMHLPIQLIREVEIHFCVMLH